MTCLGNTTNNGTHGCAMLQELEYLWNLRGWKKNQSGGRTSNDL